MSAPGLDLAWHVLSLKKIPGLGLPWHVCPGAGPGLACPLSKESPGAELGLAWHVLSLSWAWPSMSALGLGLAWHVLSLKKVPGLGLAWPGLARASLAWAGMSSL